MDKQEIDELEELEGDDLRHRLDRGDYIDPNIIKIVTRLLKKHEKERKFKESCEKASISAALKADKRSFIANIIAFLALLISIASFIYQIVNSGS
jgi:hypothetical protein